MGRFIVRRLLWVIVLLIAVTFLTFVIFYLFPSADPAALRAGRQPSPALIAQIRHNLGLDKPFIVQYWDYMKGVVLHFDLGYSYQNNISVKSQIFDRLPATISLAFGAAVIWLFAGITIGIISAVKSGSVIDRMTMGGALVAISAPVYWLGLVMLYLFATDIGLVHIFPGAGSYVPLSQNPEKWFTSLLLPWMVLAAAFAAIYARLLRSTMIESMSEDYIRTARAKGLSERRVILHHGLRSAVTPIVTAAGLDVGVLLGGAILTETVFNIPGVARFVVEAVRNRDYPIVQNLVMFIAVVVVTINFLVDVLYTVVDPRIRLA